jgi:PKD repeat protein
MKKKFLIKLFAFTFLLLVRMIGSAQTCTTSFNYSIGPNNSVTFFSISTPTGAATTYTLNYGVGYLLPFVGTGTAGVQTTVTYTTPGTYTVGLASSSCASGYTAVVVVPNCAISITSSNATGTLCSGSATANYSGYCGTPTVAWSNGGNTPSQFSLCAGLYTVMVSGGGPTCCPTGTAAVFINTVAPCNLNASFTHTLLSNGTVSFSSNSTGTIAGSFYVWQFGDGNQSTSGTSAAHSYSQPGIYNAMLTVYNNSLTCFDSSNVVPITPVFCLLSTSIIAAPNPTGSSRSFSCGAIGTTSSTTYAWNFGDGNTGTGAAVSHTYALPGTYSVSCLVNNNIPQTCTVLSVISITVPCLTSAAFAHTVGANGMVAFNNQSTGTYSASTYSWDFGDGYGDIAPNPFHQYSNAGTHFVKFTVGNSTNASCKDSVIQAINITGIPCSANAVFSLTPSTIPQVWYAVPYYPYNVTAASWNWGDGSSSNTMYASHTYSTAGTYSICLSVTVSCNSTASYCFSQYLNKPGAGAVPVYINVIPPATKVGIEKIEYLEKEVLLWPLPANDYVSYVLPNAITSVEILDLSGRVLRRQAIESETGRLELFSLSSGCYFLRFEGPLQTYTKKLMIEK